MILLDLLLGFLEVGCFAFGGAYGAIPLIREVVLSYGWLSEETLTYMIAVSESTPGPIMVNLATYIGSSQAGLPGAIVATTAVVLPAFVIMIFITAVLKQFIGNKYVQAVLAGLNPCIIGIILATGVWSIGKNVFSTTIDIKGAFLTVVLGIIMFTPIFKKKPSPILLILISALLGAVIYS